ncbi:hypothetical protein [Oceanobacillus halotolerans]|uniref:hypothetical protein n=1 Tax=Oceanobacillus halotolerans TaxID=2663380 RepID=UPI0013D9A4C1|nr:hypothetical protein [Oceanobacillus halotolerans]
MKKKLSFILNQRGFVLPYVLFIMSLAVVIIITSIHTYRNNLEITHHQLEQIRIETLFQMAYAHFLDALKESHEDIASPAYYTYQQGTVTIEHILLEKDTYHLYITVKTNKGVINTFIKEINLNQIADE